MDETEVHYQISSFYDPVAAAGHGFDDPAFAIVWPLPVSVISERDLQWPLFGITETDPEQAASQRTSTVD